MTDVVIVDSGVANLASVCGAFARLGVQAAVSAEADAVRCAPRLVLPGVGAFGAGRAALQSHGLDAAVRDEGASPDHDRAERRQLGQLSQARVVERCPIETIVVRGSRSRSMA